MEEGRTATDSALQGSEAIHRSTAVEEGSTAKEGWNAVPYAGGTLAAEDTYWVGTREASEEEGGTEQDIPSMERTACDEEVLALNLAASTVVSTSTKEKDLLVPYPSRYLQDLPVSRRLDP